MRRLTIAGAVPLFLAACTVAGPRPGADDAAPEMAAEPEVRVGIQVDVESVTVGGGDGLVLADEGGGTLAESDAGRDWTVRRAGAGLEAVGDGETVRAGSSIVVRPAGNAPIRVGDRTYRGAVLLRAAAEGVTAVNLLDMETYLLGVVPLEIGGGRPAEELEAVKAQAVAARTYAIRHIGRRADLGFDFYATVMDQVYGGAGAEDPTASRAVRETRGQIITYEGEPIEAYYHSTCGGRTAALDEVWPGEPRPYLRSVSDRKPEGGWYCETSNRFRWTEEWNEDTLEAALTSGFEQRGVASGQVTRVESMEILGRTPSGRAETLRIRTNLGEHRISGDSIRWILRPEPGRILNSTAIALETDEESGVVTHARVEGAGWGHGIGMCQIGALGRSRAGHDYREILRTYYPGTRIAELYP